MTASIAALLVSSEFPPGPGGIGTHAAALATGLASLGWRITVNTPMDHATDEEIDATIARLAASHVAVDRVRRGRALARLWNVGPRRLMQLRRLARANRAQLVIASGRAPQILCAALRGIVERPLVAIVHGSELGTGARLIDRLTCRSISTADLAVAVSDFTRDRMAAVGARATETLVIPNGAEPAQDAPFPVDAINAFRERHDIGQRPLVLTIGQLNERKAQDTIIRALPAIRSAVPDVLYVAVGLPTRRDYLLQLADSLGVASHVRLPGVASRAECQLWLHAANVFALTSRTTATGDCEGYGIAAVEAALAGLPAVVTTGSGLVEAIVPGVTGLAVPPDDPPAVAGALTRLLLDGDLRSRMGEAARSRALQEQTWDRRMVEWDRALRAVVAKTERP